MYVHSVAVSYDSSLSTLDLPRQKHPTKVHILWAGIFKKGQTGICMFEGIMNEELYTEILDSTLVPFIRSVCPQRRFMQRVYTTLHLNIRHKGGNTLTGGGNAPFGYNPLLPVLN